MSDSGVLAGAVYIPRFGVEGRRGRRFRCGSDEDAVTLAVEAGERALAVWPGGAASIGGLFVALSHGPDVHGPQSQVVREALDLSPDARVAAVAADDLAGMTALQAALDAVKSGGLGTALVVAAEAAPGPENRRSAGAAALIVSAAAAPTPENGGRAGAAAALVSAVAVPTPAVRIDEVARHSALTHEDWRPAGGGAASADGRFLQHRYRTVLREV